MLESSWEIYATALANASSSDEFIQSLHHIVEEAEIDLENPSRVVYARDTRPSGSELMTALEAGLKVMAVHGRNEGIKTTPVLHYLVRCINTIDTAEAYGLDNEAGYMEKLSNAFRELVVCAFSNTDFG